MDPVSTKSHMVLLHVQMGNLADSVSEETSLRHKYEAPLSMAHLRRSTSLSSRPHAEPTKVSGGGRGGFMRWALPSICLSR